MKRVKNLLNCALSLAGLLAPLACWAQVSISGRVTDKSDARPLPNANVFLSNTTNGAKTAADGSFIITGVKPGKYDLVVSMVGYQTADLPVNIFYNNIALPDISLSAKIITLNEVKISNGADPNRGYYLDEFKKEFLGSSERAAQCTIVNPDVLYFDNNDATGTLSAYSNDFLEIDNEMLGYRVKYLLDTFSAQFIPSKEMKVFFRGAVLFEEMKGSPSTQAWWEANRIKAYQNSPMHFLRAALAGKLEQEGFRVQQYAVYTNPDRPVDNIIEQKINYYKSLQNPADAERDSLSLWIKRKKLPKTFEKLLPWALNKQDFVSVTTAPGVYQLGCENNALFVTYDERQHFHIADNINYLYNESNTSSTLIKFNGANALFNGNGVITDLNSVSFTGIWSNNRLAELLPYNYAPPQSTLAADVSEGIASELQKYLTSHPAEKAWLQFDKPWYAAGDTIYFKAYVISGEEHRLSGLSGVLHVELINTTNKIDQAIKLKLDSGLAWGDFALPDSLPAGNYRVRAYTQWMRNFGETGFFEKVIAVGAVKRPGTPESMVKTNDQKAGRPDIQFLPECGALIAGIPQKVAFKAVDANGLGIAVKGVVTNQDGNEVTAFVSAHLGMGYCRFTPKAGGVYKAKIAYANGTDATVNLPPVEASGITMTVDNDSLPKASVQIEANTAYFEQNRGKVYTLVIYSPGTATTVNCKLDSPVIKLDILKRKLHTGVAAITLFSPENGPLCERLLFIQNYDRLDLNLITNKNTYGPREGVNIRLNAVNRRGEPALGHFSVSVTDESKVPEADVNADNILTHLLLTSDLKGYVEQPEHYFSDTTASALGDLDLLMLTQGYRRFEWKQVLDSASRPVVTPPEGGIEIAGKVNDAMGKAVPNGTVTLISTKGGQFLTTQSDSKGVFHFTNLIFADTARFVLNAVKANGKNSTKITWFGEGYDRPAVQPFAPGFDNKPADTVLQSYVEKDKAQRAEVANYVKNKGIMLKQVNVRDTKPDDKYETQSLAGAGNADQVLHANEIGSGPSLSAMLNGKIRGGIFFNGGFPYNRKANLGQSVLMSVYVDGERMWLNPQIESLGINIINAGEVETVEVLTSPANEAIYGMDGAHGVLIITTKKGHGERPEDISSTGVLPINAMGFYKARVFYSPRYDNPALINKQRDLRSTIYWNPEIQTDAASSASFDFFNADGAGTYKVVVEGVDKDGNIGRQVFRYEVK